MALGIIKRGSYLLSIFRKTLKKCIIVLSPITPDLKPLHSFIISPPLLCLQSRQTL